MNDLERVAALADAKAEFWRMKYEEAYPNSATIASCHLMVSLRFADFAAEIRALNYVNIIDAR